VGDGMQVDDGVQGAGKAFDQQLVGDLVCLHARWLQLPLFLEVASCFSRHSWPCLKAAQLALFESCTAGLV
jgi:hypothetical protein